MGKKDKAVQTTPLQDGGFASAHRVELGSPVKLAVIPTDYTGGWEKEAALQEISRNVAQLNEVAGRLYADNRSGVLVVLQGRDTSGKDGTIRHLFTGVNPQSCRTTSFGVPSSLEADHDYLWRIHQACPRKGEIGIFNRSHYEDVLVVRVEGLVEPAVWKKRYEQINQFEQLLSESGFVVLKFFLHISKDEQAKRLRERLDDPSKNWKMQLSDLKTREKWGDYQAAYEDALSKCSTPHAPWHIIPSDKKWYRNLAIGEIIVDRLQRLDLRYPKLSFDPKKVKVV